MDPVTDFLTVNPNGGLAAHGPMAARLVNAAFNPQELRTLDVLRKDEWIAFDETVVEVARERLGAVEDLMSRGLRYGLDNAMGRTSLEWEQISDMTPADVSMAAVTDSERDRMEFVLQSTPLPIVHKGFRMNARHLAATRASSIPLDTAQAAMATRLVAEGVEDMLFNGAPIQAIGGQVYGITTAPSRNVGSLTYDWSAPATTGPQILEDVQAMKQALKTDHMFGPYGLYVSEDWDTKLDEDYVEANSSNRTIRARLLELSGMQFIRPTERLTGGANGEVALVQLTRDVIDVIDGMQPTPVQWEEKGGLIIEFVVMAIIVPRPKHDWADQSGIAHFTKP